MKALKILKFPEIQGNQLRKMQGERGSHQVFPRLKFLGEEEQEALKVLSFKPIISMTNEMKQDKELFRRWWTESVLSAKAQKQLEASQS